MTENTKPTKFADITVNFRNGTGVNFTDILGYQVGGGAVGVTLNDGTTHVYPLDLVAEVIHQPIEQA